MNFVGALLRRLICRIRLERYLRKWSRDLAALRVGAKPPATRSVLFCELMTLPSTAKFEALLAGLLRLRGYRSVVLLEKEDKAIERIFRAAVPDAEFVRLNREIGEAQTEEAARRAELLIVQAGDLQKLVKLEIDGFRIGRNVQSWVLRQFRVGRLDNSDLHHQAAALKTLTRSLAVKGAIDRLFASDAPDIAVFNERGYTPAGEVFDACVMNGVDALQWCGAPQSDRLIYRRYEQKTRAEHPLALSEEMWAKLQTAAWSDEDDQAVVNRISANYASGAWYNRQQLQDGKAILAPDDVRKALKLDPAKKTAVIFAHILYDATFFYGESLFDDYEQWLVETVRAAIANPNLNWVVKVHPVNVWRSKMDGAPLVQLEAEALERALGVLPDHIKIMPSDTAINTFSLFDVAGYGLTVRGTIGMELPCFGIPVVTAGTGRYAERGFTVDPTTRDAYLAALATLHEMPRLDRQSVRRARLHYYGALNLRPVPMKSFVLDFQTEGGLFTSDVFLKRPADERLLETDDLGRLTDWAIRRETPELLAKDI